MSDQHISLLNLTVLLTGTVTAKRFVNHAGTQALAASNTLGVADYAGVAGDYISVCALGTAIVETGGVIPAGSLIETDATGRAIVRASGPIVARALPSQSSSAAGQYIEVLLINN